MSKISLPPQSHQTNLGQLHDFLGKTEKDAQLRGVVESTKHSEASKATSGNFDKVIYLSSRAPEPAQKAAGKSVAAQRKLENERAKSLVLNTLNGALISAKDPGLVRAIENAIGLVQDRKTDGTSALKAGQIFKVIDAVVKAEKQANAAAAAKTSAPPRGARPTDVRGTFAAAYDTMRAAEKKSAQAMFHLPLFEQLEVKTRTDSGRAGMRTLASAFMKNAVPSDPADLKGLYQEWQAMKSDGRVTAEILGENAGMAAIDGLLTACAAMGVFSKSPPA